MLLLTTTGRKTGKLHTIGLQYERIDGKYYLGAADGTRADWYRNTLKNDEVFVQAGPDKFNASASVINDHDKITDFLEYRMNKRPMMIRLILRIDGIKGKIDRAALERYASRIRLVVLNPLLQSEA